MASFSFDSDIANMDSTQKEELHQFGAKLRRLVDDSTKNCDLFIFQEACKLVQQSNLSTLNKPRPKAAAKKGKKKATAKPAASSRKRTQKKKSFAQEVENGIADHDIQQPKKRIRSIPPLTSVQSSQ